MCGAGWVPDSRAFLNLSPRCSSEELLDRLFKKSVVTEAEVTAPCLPLPSNTGPSTPQLRHLLRFPRAPWGVAAPRWISPSLSMSSPSLMSPGRPYLAGRPFYPPETWCFLLRAGWCTARLEESSGLGGGGGFAQSCPVGPSQAQIWGKWRPCRWEQDREGSGGGGGGRPLPEPWPLLQIKVYVQQLVEGLHYLHNHSILHLDIKVLSSLGVPRDQEGQVGAWGLLVGGGCTG